MNFLIWTGYDVIACSDGAFHYLKDKNFPLDKLDFISGDFDSHEGSDENIYHEKFIHTPDQDFTDFQKAFRYSQKSWCTKSRCLWRKRW